MLKQRLMTAAVLIPLVVWALLTLNSQVVFVLFVIVAALSGWEWLSLIQLPKPLKVIALILLAPLLMVILECIPIDVTLKVISLVWLLATLFVVRYAHKPLSQRWRKLFQSQLFGTMMAALILIGFVIAAVSIHQLPQHGPALLLNVLVVVWLADTGGYFAGKRFGKKRLAKEISPNKTWEGVVGALVLSSAWSIGFYYFVDGLAWSLLTWLVFTWLIVAVSVVGDLFESIFKRCFQVKDSGQLLPGHGGMLDRIDSLLAAIPVAAMLLLTGV